MAETYSQIYIHIIFAVKGRQRLISNRFKEQLYKYITGIVSNKGHKLICINGMPDHLHILIGLMPSEALSDLVRDIKVNSSKFINRNSWVSGKFNWQEGYGAFSPGRSHLNRVINYIQNQEKHHQRKTFETEYMTILQHSKIPYKKEYLF